MEAATLTQVFAELNEKGDRIEVHFNYSKEAVFKIKRVPGYKFVPADRGGPFWQLPMDITSARKLRDEFGEGLELGKAVKKWAKDVVRQETQLRSLSQATDAKLERLPKLLPDLAKYLRPYQRADAAFMATVNAINANHPGLGKTVATIAAIYEAGLYDGPQLVVAPKTSLEAVWLKELDAWLPEEIPVFVVSGDDSKKMRQDAMEEFSELAQAGEACWLVTNPAMVRYVRNPEFVDESKGAAGDRPQDYGEEVPEVDEFVPAWPELFDVEYKTATFDEYHKSGLTNPKAKMFLAANAIEAERKFLLSGTPMGGKPIKLWAALHFLQPEKYTSRWRWVDQWLEVEEKETRRGTFKSILGIRDGLEDSFYDALAPHMVRRTKKEVINDLPDKQIIDIWVKMTPKQQKQYNAMAADAEVRIENESLTATGILAEYMRLKQFAGAHQKVRTTGSGELVVKPTQESGKLPFILDKLNELGISGDPDEQEGNDKVVIGSQFSSMVDMYEEWLEGLGIETLKITGDVNRKGERKRIVEDFQNPDGPRVLLLTTTAGGVSITLDTANTMIITDETWDPDDQEQLEDRSWWRGDMDKANLTVYYVRSKDSIEEYIQNVTFGKAITNKEILDLRRKGFRAIQ